MFCLHQQQSPSSRLQVKVKLKSHRFVTQIEYRDDRKIIIGWIGEFLNGGKTVIYSKDDPNYMYKGFWHNYKATLDGVHWSRTWMTYSGAIRYLIGRHGFDVQQGLSRIVPYPQTFLSTWKPLDYNEDNR